jgi:hypothetical protein
MSNRLEAYRLNGRPAGRAPRRSRIAPMLVALICALLAIASVTIGQPKVDAPELIG